MAKSTTVSTKSTPVSSSESTSNGSSRRTECAITRESFKANAKPIMVKIGDQGLVGTPKEFSTGSFGFNTSGKIPVDVGGTIVMCQVSLNLIVVGSKEA